MVRCQKCGTEFDEQYGVCPACGTWYTAGNANAGGGAQGAPDNSPAYYQGNAADPQYAAGNTPPAQAGHDPANAAVNNVRNEQGSGQGYAPGYAPGNDGGYYQQQPPKKSGKGGLVAVIIILSVLLVGAVVGLLIFAFGSKGGDGQPSDQSSVQSSDLQSSDRQSSVQQSSSDQISEDTQSSQNSDSGYESAMNEARSALSKKDYDKALTLLAEVIKLKPGETEPYILSADAYMGKGDVEGEKKILEEGEKATGSEDLKTRLNTVNYNAALDKGKEALDNKDYDKAITLFADAIKLDPKQEKPYSLSADACLGKGDVEGAAKILNEGIKQTNSQDLKTKKDGLPDAKKAYLEVVNNLVAKSGEAHTNPQGGYLMGLAVVRLVDFDGDGQDELLVGYSDGTNQMYANKQAVYKLIGSKAVSVYQGDVNSRGGVGPYMQYIERSDGAYLAVDSKMQAYVSQSWAEIDENGASVIAKFEHGDMEDSKYLINGSTVTEQEYRKKMEQIEGSGTLVDIDLTALKSKEVLSDTFDVLDGLGYDTSKVRSAQSANELYNEYISTGDFSKHKHYDGGGVPVVKSVIFDYDGDGMPELWVSSSCDVGGPRNETFSEFCTIENGKVKRLLNCAESGGTIGGDYVGIEYSKSDDRLLISTAAYSGGWGGTSNSMVMYSLSGGTLKQEASTASTIYNSHNNPEEQDVYNVDDEDVTKEKYESARDNYVFVSLDDFKKVLSQSSSLSNKEKLEAAGIYVH